MKDKLLPVVARLKPAIRIIRRYMIFIFMLFMLFIFGFFVLRINEYSRIEPSDEDVQAKLQTVQRPRLDQSVLNKIQQLQGQNVQVKSLFDQARDNPFHE